MTRRLCFLALTYSLLASSTPAESATVPLTVSPGSLARSAQIADACPAFSWAAVPDATGYELALYRLGDATAEPELVFRQRIEGAALSWTPPLERCLEPGGRYAWAVRARVGDRATEWSPPNLFEVASAPSPQETAPLLGATTPRRGTGTPADDLLAGNDEPTRPADAARTAGARPKRSAAPASAPTLMSVQGNVAATSFSGDGSALTNIDWSALANVPAGFADGSDDGIVYAAGNQLLLNATTFDVVEGSGSDLDADLVDGQHAAAFAQQATTYTKTEVDSLLTVENISAPIPVAPSRLRIGPEPRFPGQHRLSWNMSSLAGVAAFTVYQADFPITDLNKTTTHRRVTGTLYAPVDLYPGSGVQFFRVEAQNVLGEPGPLSPELLIDTTSRLAFHADLNLDERFELFSAPSDGASLTVVSADPPVDTADVHGDYSWSPDATRIAYVADQDVDGVFELYVAPASGGGSTRINQPITPGGGVREFAWSPDGSRLAYVASESAGGSDELYTADAGGGLITKINGPLAPGGQVFRYIWSPDGAQLAYTASQESSAIELYAAPASGGGPIKLNTTPGDVGSIAWSPDGTRLAYIADEDGDGRGDLNVTPASGGGYTKINPTLVPGGQVWDFAWSPDGSRLAYKAQQDSSDLDLYVAPATGGDSTRINTPLAGGGVWTFAWSPDGSRLAYRAEQEVLGSVYLYVAPATGGGSQRPHPSLPPGTNIAHFAWSPDGSQIGFLADFNTPGTNQLYTVKPDCCFFQVNPTLVPGSGGVFSFAWSPDSSRLAYRADQDDANVIELYVADSSGGGNTRVHPKLALGQNVDGFAWSPLGWP